MSLSGMDGLMALVTASAGVGVLHTLLGPDHYLPLLALGRARRWSSKRTLVMTAVAGLAHCLASFSSGPQLFAVSYGAGARGPTRRSTLDENSTFRGGS